MVKAQVPEHFLLQALWLIKTRWFIAVAATVAIAFTYILQLANILFGWMALVTLSIFLINGGYLLHLKMIRNRPFSLKRRAVILNINAQISIDFLLLTMLIHFSGGIENPMLIFYVFHMIIASIILSRRSAFLQAGFAIFLFSSLTALEYLEILPHYSLNSHLSAFIFSNKGYLIFSLLVFITASVLIVYFTSTLALRLRKTQSKLRTLNEELLRKDDVKNEYVQRVTHNIKGDLSTIKSCLAVVKSQETGAQQEQYKTFLNKAYDRTGRLTEFVEDLLILTNMRLNKRFDTVEFNVAELLTNVVDQLQAFAESKNTILALELPEVPVVMFGIKVSIHEALYNVVHNAVKYTPDGGDVKVVLKKESGKIKITVADTGMGIPQEAIPHLFDEFYRADNVGEKEGTGLGLALVKAIIGRHSGKIEVNSELNKGSVFTITLFASLKTKIKTDGPF